MKTLQQIIDEHPDWANLPVAVIDVVGNLHYVDQSGAMFVSEDEGEQVLIFGPN